MVPSGVAFGAEHRAGTVLNDIHSRLNETRVAEYHEPETAEAIAALIRRAADSGRAVSISGGRHSMGGQQFGAGTLHINLSRFSKVHGLDRDRGLVTVDSGIQWPELIDWLIREQAGDARPWGIRQKQTGADQLSIGGALSANIHGRGLTMKPIVGDVESFELLDANGSPVRCSRDENPELFRLAIGGYGLFGVITKVTLRLSPRTKLRRAVEIVALPDVTRLVRERIADGYLYGDFQFKTDERAEDFLKAGVFSFYQPVAVATPVPESQASLSGDAWKRLYQLAHQDKAQAFEAYSKYYLATDGQLYWSDLHQLSYYVTGEDAAIDRARSSRAPGSLMICEFYTPRERLEEFMTRLAGVLRREGADLIYGTVRFIERDDESFLAWAREPFACVVINLRVLHDARGIDDATRQFRAVTDEALAVGGSYFLTYHRWATKDQVLRAYPRFVEFLRSKLRHDPRERFQSEWYRHYKAMFADELRTE